MGTGKYEDGLADARIFEDEEEGRGRLESASTRPKSSLSRNYAIPREVVAQQIFGQDEE